MKSMIGTVIGLVLSGCLLAQAPKPAPAKAAPANAAEASPSALDKIFQLVSMKLPDASIISSIQAAGKTLQVTPDDLIRFKGAGASDNVIVALSNVMAGAPAAPDPAAPAAASASYNTDLSTVRCEASATAPRRVLAVDEFDYGTVKDQVAALFGTQIDIGKGIQALFTKRVQEQGKFRVVERSNVKKVLAEQDFGASNRVKQGTQSRVGRIVGADAILMGTIVTFGRDDKRRSIGGLGYGPRVLGGVKLKVGENKAVVAISYRLVDAESTEVLATGEARGESTRTQNGVDVGVLTRAGGGAGGVDMTSANFAQTIIGEATIAAVDQLAKLLGASEGKIAARNVEVESRIADVADQKIYLSAGSADGVNKCDRFEIHKVIREVKDPVTKDVIDVITEKVGDYIATEVRDRVTIGVFQGTSKPEVGFLAKRVQR